MIAAREELIQASQVAQAQGQPVPVTPSMLQSALASAGLPSSSPVEGSFFLIFLPLQNPTH